MFYGQSAPKSRDSLRLRRRDFYRSLRVARLQHEVGTIFCFHTNFLTKKCSEVFLKIFELLFLVGPKKQPQSSCQISRTMSSPKIAKNHRQACAGAPGKRSSARSRDFLGPKMRDFLRSKTASEQYLLCD